MKPRKKQRLYAISYWFTNEDGQTGQGCVQIYRSTKINNIDAFNYTVEKIKSDNNLKTVVICNIMYLGKIKV
jgi:hypothetical protein